MSKFHRTMLPALLAILGGCQGQVAEFPTATVTGQVSLDGQPLTKGTVIFTPPKGRSASGVIQSDGAFELSTYGNRDGAVVGEHEVIIQCTDQPPVAPGEFVEVGKLPKWLIPKRYGQPSESGLSFTVVAGEDNVANFELTTE